jgi:hypothetical protein
MFWCASVLAQTTGPQLVSEVNLATPKPGMQAQFEEGRKRHSAFHAAQKDTWSIYVWEILTGERSGTYMMASPGHSWKDLDAREAFDKIDQPDVAKNLQPSMGAAQRMYYVYRDDLSLTKPPATPAKLRVATSYWIAPDHINDFIDAVKKVNEAIKKTNYPAKPSRWYSLASGGEVPQFVLISDRESWADMEPIEKTLDSLMKEQYPDANPLDTIRKSTRRLMTEVHQFRPDLSYMAKQ